ncbi:cytochrome P450 monooxygenase [Dissoconium aciculare CBS 342.82]|uniref:Cytochrome P450 monooxygenase n=1 Tax=Dissoconium aciculare CBS 342.82 TaxID=1314786 RepID=A0A6J3LQF1_9PEZI|nr:cytochrome P450 monooxygenase [Dissoconium aciculare CBS 342.82]KAF1818121.1 cytochrome P450 monooxygenase [Dissoconium aciculare CBS 342.82]
MSSLSLLSSVVAPSVLAVSVVLYLISLLVYRWYLHPLAGIPGPKIAAATGLVEMWYDIVRGGQYVFQLERWHAEYGPIIRIAPNHVHFLDPDFFDELYSMKHPRHMKLAHLRDRFNTPTSIGDTPDADEHDRHRALLAPLFSRQRVAELTGYVQTRADKLCANVLRAAAAGPAVRLDAAWSTYATDNVLWYTLSLAYDFLDYPDFKSPFTEATGKLLWSIHWLTHFPGLMKLFNAIPHEYVEKLSPDIGAIFGFQREVRAQIHRVIDGENDGHRFVQHRTVFHEISQVVGRDAAAIKMMEDDGVSITLAGIETSARAASVISFWVLKRPEIRARLQAELEAAIPDPDHMPALAELEKLPYLNAVLQEGLRLGYGVSNRLSRYNPQIPIRYGQHVLPPYTVFSMTPALQHRNARVFPEPLSFHPERWLLAPSSSLSSSTTNPPLSKYLVQFSKGPRNCIGMHLATAELVIGIATFVRRLGHRLVLDDGVGEAVVDLGSDYIAAVASDVAGGLRVRLVSD